MTVLGEQLPALVVVQHSVHFELKARYAALVRTRVVNQGDNALSFFEPEKAPESTPV